MSRLIAIGDIHGCAAALDAVLAEIRLQPDDCLVLLGDYVDRGPDSRQVINRILALQQKYQVIPLMGNHELMMLDSFEDHSQAFYWLQCGGKETLDSYGGDPTDVPREHLDFIRGCRPYYETDGHLFVHANYNPELELSEQPHELLYWMHLHVQFPAAHRSGKMAVVGHTPQKDGNVLDGGHLICLDTYCVGDGWLTAMDLANRRIWQANKAGELRKDVTEL